MLAEEIRDLISISEVAKLFNLNIKGGHGREPCPFCGSATGFVVRSDKNYKCYRCGESGNVFDLLIKSGKANNFGHAYNLLKKFCKDSSTYHLYQERIATYEEVFKCYLEAADSEVYSYAASRGWNKVLNDYPLGYCPEPNYLISKGFKLKDLEHLGLLNRLKQELMVGRVIFPIRNSVGKLVHLQGRSLNPEDKLRWLSTIGYPPISSYLFNAEKLGKEYRDYVYITEGLTDCYSLLELGKPALATFGVNIDFNNHATKLSSIREVIAFFDNDRYPIDGTDKSNQYKSWQTIIPALIELSSITKLKLGCLTPPSLSGVKDVNDWLKEINYDQTRFQNWGSKNIKTLPAFSLEVLGYKNIKIWELLKHQPDNKTKNLLLDYVQKEYKDWSEYLLEIL